MAIDSMYGGSQGLSLTQVNQSIYQGLSTQEAKLRDTLASIGSKADGAVTQAELLRMQQEVQQWTMLIDIQSTITKQIGDSIKSVIQKSG
ncbi:EscF/YscF/HrpA family type III secretion system needle major subunit [Alcaligenes endophyticus]|uniref:EscF/YscF/HrpA family type III secretion system needle major subunit n=1 Tax=Alcaligenes endophyticus TaxID=1929088 RepID=A0ABT8EFM0_9BURK|nr:EscF/YscF/HrpA family type III secretion system needle major subunit [Alcaligenes endophyticus]MCX5590260.1 type III secretion protein [Alcaligenes endophyticus]MDN4120076.1 EscF/YscF/HrpA family type III secretion system needle major subunit [Alcaligenes endophyticus]